MQSLEERTNIKVIERSSYFDMTELCADLMHSPGVYTLKTGEVIEVFDNGSYQVIGNSKNQLAKVYRDYVNNYLTVERISEAYSLSNNDMIDLIQLGKFYHNQMAMQSKLAKNK